MLRVPQLPIALAVVPNLPMHGRRFPALRETFPIRKHQLEDRTLLQHDIDQPSPQHPQVRRSTPWHWLMLVVHTVIAISLVALTTVAIIDSLTMRNTLSQEETSAANCEEQPRFRS